MIILFTCKFVLSNENNKMMTNNPITFNLVFKLYIAVNK